MWPSCTPHCVSCPFISPSLCLSVLPVYVLVTRKKDLQKSKFPRTQVSGVPIFGWKGQRSRSPDVKKFKKLLHFWHTCLLTGDRSSADGLDADCKLDLTVVRLNLLSTPEMLGNWTDGRISCRHSMLTFLLLGDLTVPGLHRPLNWP